ncbi:threonine--tRNA ligase [Acinetobacter sp.]|uniref:threonine--tRNA ligase n=1 Tax=Acinetobacter sp. TaxID=472 RepID=UPI0037519040
MNIIEKGLAVLTPEDAIIRREIEKYLSHLLEYHDYLPVYSPHIGDIALFTTSGHYPYYKDSMFPLIEETALNIDEIRDISPDRYALKPMNCPFHIQAYQSEPRSYRDLPVRYYEFGTVYRNESSGAINGMFRLRGFTQDDGHIFCTMEQVENEVVGCINLVQEVMKKFEMEVTCKLSIRSFEVEDQSKYVGNDLDWKKAQDILLDCIPSLHTLDPFGAAFYGPKIDFIAKDKLGRDWQLGTVQLDFNLPDRFNLSYKASENGSERPVMIHRALLGSLERFIGILKEQGPLPIWLQKEQVRIIPVHEELLSYAKEVRRTMKQFGIRATVDEEVAPLSAKVKNCIEAGVPIRAVVGKQEKEKEQITVHDADGKEVMGYAHFCTLFEEMYS